MRISRKHKAIIVLLKAIALCEQSKGRTNRWINELVNRLSAVQRGEWLSHTINVNMIEERLIPLINRLSQVGSDVDITQEEFEGSVNILISGLGEGNIINQRVLEYIACNSDKDSLDDCTIIHLLQIWYKDYHVRGQIVDLTKARNERSTAADVGQSQSPDNFSIETRQGFPEPRSHILGEQRISPVADQPESGSNDPSEARQVVADPNPHTLREQPTAPLIEQTDCEGNDTFRESRNTRHPFLEKRLHIGRRRRVSESDNPGVSSVNDQESSDEDGENDDSVELPTSSDEDGENDDAVELPITNRLQTGRRRCVSESDAQAPVCSKPSIMLRFNGEGAFRRMFKRSRSYSEGEAGQSSSGSQTQNLFASQPSIFTAAAANLTIRFQMRDL
ncbi:uncharacterized protein LOC127851350 isoform X2 [Dreissena polymorpha]|uniref:uncharacterized protein LOC127851350 isoform X2 n=1 Tax=Dreissena polymorpha TaxID=45954 RepID=UPI002264A824|nr:uncharacterized protein LOC127851350 isoform X2 [Dreissena polymorpha]